jgi:hypothetical protein
MALLFSSAVDFYTFLVLFKSLAWVKDEVFKLKDAACLGAVCQRGE